MERKFVVGMIASMFCWGFSWPISKILTLFGAPQDIALIRFAFTFLSLLIILFFLKEKLTINKNGLVALFAASILMTCYGFLFLKGLQHGMSGAGGVLVTTLNPILTYLLSFFILMKRPTWKELSGLLVGLVAGVVLLQLWQSPERILDAGNLYFLVATITWAVLSKVTSLSARYGSPVVFSLWMYFACTCFMAFFVEPANIAAIFQRSNSSFWLSLFFSATITTSLATTFYFYATTKIGSNTASSYIFLVPLSASLGSWWILGEVPLWNTVVGGCIGVLAVFILTKKSKSIS